MIQKNHGIRLIPVLLVLLSVLSCTSTSKGIYSKHGLSSDDKKFLFSEPDNEEDLYRIFLTSEQYLVTQKGYDETIARVPDMQGDRYICNEICGIDMIDETREGIVSILLYPDSGKVMKVRTKKSTFIMEIDKIITEDMQRWRFTFPQETIEPIKFDIRYRVKLRKRQSDEEIMREVRENMREQN